MSNQDDLQTLVLTTLDKQGVIEDSANLKTASGANVDQLALLGALNSLRSKDVRAKCQLRASIPTSVEVLHY